MLTRIVSIQVGAAREVPMGESVRRTAYFKSSVLGPVRVSFAGLEGDEQAVADVHGGPDRAVLAYAAAHYEHWRRELPSQAWAPGAFAENLTIEGVDEHSVCIGDRYRAGSVVLEVSVPRTPCGSISQASGVSDLFERVESTGRTGWLHRVIEEGILEVGAELILCARPQPEWSVVRAAEVMARARRYERANVDAALALSEVSELAERWRVKLRERADQASQDE
jgi:MOSC domain-containing protein YiiM